MGGLSAQHAVNLSGIIANLQTDLTEPRLLVVLTSPDKLL